jgi:hypothetical protein
MRRRRSALDRLIYRLQDRWETDRQYRAMMSGVLGLVIVIALCSCMGVVTTIANNAVASVNAARNGGVTSSQNVDTGTGLVKSVPTFPTSTVPPWQQGSAPTFSTIPESKTPVPSPSAGPTATAQPPVPCTSNCGGGGGGGGGSFTATLTGSASPATWIAGQAGSFTVHSSPGGVGLAFIITFPGGGTFLDENGHMTDGSGNYTTHFTVPGGTTAGKADVYLQAYYNGVKKDFHFPVACLP